MSLRALRKPENWIVLNAAVLIGLSLLVSNRVFAAEQIGLIIYNVISALVGFFFIKTIRVGSPKRRNVLSWLLVVFMAILPLAFLVLAITGLLDRE